MTAADIAAAAAPADRAAAAEPVAATTPAPAIDAEAANAAERLVPRLFLARDGGAQLPGPPPKAKKKTWVPLESNPEVMTAFARRLGMPEQFAFHDVFGLDEELLMMVPQPVRALILLFPITETSEAFAKAQDAELAAAAAAAAVAGGAGAGAAAAAEAPAEEGVYYMKQTVGNACGTIAMLHAIAASREAMGLVGGDDKGGGGGAKEDGAKEDDDERSFLRRFFAATASLSPGERADFIESPPPGAPDLEAAHARAATRGDTAAPRADDDVDLHFVALVPWAGRVWELDGRRRAPVDHGPIAVAGDDDDGAVSFLAEAARVAREFVAREAAAGGSIQFNVIALGPADDADEE
jgi:ubiquitin carboxyl-terminal hydrolase L3